MDIDDWMVKGKQDLPTVTPDWLPVATLDELTPQGLRRLAPSPTDVAPATSWHRLRGPDDLSRLDPRLEGWEATRALLPQRSG